MKNLLFCAICGVCAFFFVAACKRYNEGGWSHRAAKHLTNKSTKHWSVGSYEVNGVDSAAIFKVFLNGYSRDYDLEFMSRGGSRSEFDMKTHVDAYRVILEQKNTTMWFDPVDPNTTAQYVCTSQVCQRNIFIPEGIQNIFRWHILRLTDEQLVIRGIGKNVYKITLNASN